jgi:hypothetical protein
MSIISSAVTTTALPCRIFSLISAIVFLTLKLFKGLFRLFGLFGLFRPGNRDDLLFFRLRASYLLNFNPSWFSRSSELPNFCAS